MMYIQENEEKLPGKDFWSVVDGASGKILICPTAGKKIANAYGFNVNIAGKGLGEIADPVSVLLTADALSEDNYLAVPGDIDMRHVNKAIGSYVDGHVIYGATGASLLVAREEDSLLKATDSTSYNSTEVTALGAGIDAGFLKHDPTTKWSLTTDTAGATAFVPNATHGHVASTGEWRPTNNRVGIYLKDSGTWGRDAAHRTNISGPALCTDIYSSGNNVYISRKLLESGTAEVWVLEMDYWACAYQENGNPGNGFKGFRIQDNSKNDIVDFLWSTGQNDNYGIAAMGVGFGTAASNNISTSNGSNDVTLGNTFNFIVGPATAATSTKVRSDVMSMMDKKWHKIKIVVADGKAYCSLDGKEVVVDAKNNWKNPSSMFIMMQGYTFAAAQVYQNVNFTTYTDRAAVIAATGN